MPFNLIDAAKNMIPHDLISREANNLGEKEGSLQKAFTGAIPAILTGLLGKISNTGTAAILDMVKQASGSVQANESNNFVGSTVSVSNWLHSLFGDRLGGLTSGISNFAGIKTTSAERVLNLAAPAALAALGRYSKDTTHSAAGLGSYLQSQKAAIIGSVPSGLDLAGALGISKLSDIGQASNPVFSSAASYTSEAAKQRNHWPWLLVLLLAVIFVWMLVSRHSSSEY